VLKIISILSLLFSTLISAAAPTGLEVMKKVENIGTDIYSAGFSIEF
jgi:hypothetical protein